MSHESGKIKLANGVSKFKQSMGDGNILVDFTRNDSEDGNDDENSLEMEHRRSRIELSENEG